MKKQLIFFLGGDITSVRKVRTPCRPTVLQKRKVFSCEDAAQQVLMYVCPSVRVCVCGQVEILPSYSIQCNSRMFQNVPECSRMHAEISRMLQNACRMLQNVAEYIQNSFRMFQNVPECMQLHKLS